MGRSYGGSNLEWITLPPTLMSWERTQTVLMNFENVRMSSKRVSLNPEDEWNRIVEEMESWPGGIKRDFSEEK